ILLVATARRSVFHRTLLLGLNRSLVAALLRRLGGRHEHRLGAFRAADLLAPLVFVEKVGDLAGGASKADRHDDFLWAVAHKSTRRIPPSGRSYGSFREM